MIMAFMTSLDAFAAALLDASKPIPTGVTSARGCADAVRFAVYRNNVFVGLTKALAQRFPVTELLVGTEFFTGMARAYAQDNKPASPLIISYGDDFADFIAAFEPAKSVTYLADVARLEAAWTRAYHAADEVPLALPALTKLAPETLAQLRMELHPSAELVASQYPIGSIWASHQDHNVLPVTEWRGEAVLLVRPELIVDVHVLPAQDVAFLKALSAGATLGEAAEIAFEQASIFDFGAALVGLVTLGAFRAFNSEQGEAS
ncbi:DNA-binding domain-containing protein [Mesorhizobium sp. M7A.F.Ca.ET.027.03.2.1]|uniref:HvfC/BufC N-terminal domain-containing protein n=1 Tax=Mesorhizobium sp. M7A.F.Ca.ET.027.03.2.1 TaxID=2496656 RepID=UPI000FC9A880|nr:DNA-binding domain-containing protein [Mesorhizobium sp. M7A.F.Ca.ET.027.03.2.1]RVD56749.1 DUF2063 domain-containing protein [Mesorhizobium sp. M7A.F.Ca.ET.027.03.2.1]